MSIENPEKVTPLNEDMVEKVTSLGKTLSSQPKKKKIAKKKVEMVTGYFRNWESPKAPVTFTYSVGKQKRPEVWKFKDNEKRTIPKYIAQHINDSCRYPVHERRINKDGSRYERKEMVRRYTFEDRNFFED